jgi:hypothetical protein
VCFLLLILILIYLLTAVGLTPGGTSTVHIYTQIIVHIYTQTIVGDKQHRNMADFLRFRANTQMTPQFLLVNTCFTSRSLYIHAAKVIPSCGSHQIVYPNHTFAIMSKFQGPSFNSVFNLNDVIFCTAVHKTWAPTRSNRHLSRTTLSWTGVLQPLLMHVCYMSLIL